GAVAGLSAGLWTAGAATAALPCRAVARSAPAGSAVLASPGAETRRFTFSTTTALLRPWLKLWRTTPCSTPRLSVSVLVGVTLSVLSPGFFVSVIHIPVLSECLDHLVQSVRTDEFLLDCHFGSSGLRTRLGARADHGAPRRPSGTPARKRSRLRQR